MKHYVCTCWCNTANVIGELAERVILSSTRSRIISVTDRRSAHIGKRIVQTSFRECSIARALCVWTLFYCRITPLPIYRNGNRNGLNNVLDGIRWYLTFHHKHQVWTRVVVPGLWLCVTDECTLEDVTPLVYVTHAKYHHFHGCKTCPHHWIVQISIWSPRWLFHCSSGNLARDPGSRWLWSLLWMRCCLLLQWADFRHASVL